MTQRCPGMQVVSESLSVYLGCFQGDAGLWAQRCPVASVQSSTLIHTANRPWLPFPGGGGYLKLGRMSCLPGGSWLSRIDAERLSGGGLGNHPREGGNGLSVALRAAQGCAAAYTVVQHAPRRGLASVGALVTALAPWLRYSPDPLLTRISCGAGQHGPVRDIPRRGARTNVTRRTAQSATPSAIRLPAPRRAP